MKQETLPLQSRIGKNQFVKLSDLAAKKGFSISMMVRMILIEYLEAK